MKKLSLAPHELDRFYELVRAANDYGLPGDKFIQLESPLACAVRSIPVGQHPDDQFGDGIHTEALMGCIMGALHQITGTLESNRWIMSNLWYRFLGMCSPEGKHEEFENLDHFMFLREDLFSGGDEVMSSFAFEPRLFLYDVEPGRTLAICRLNSEGYSCLLAFEIIANNS